MGQNGTVSVRGRKDIMGIFLIVLIFIILLLVPFLMGVIELYKPQDSSPLFIEMDRSKDPRYLGKSFRYILENAIQYEDISPGMKEVKLSKKETLEITGTKKIHAGEEGRHVYYVRGDFVSSPKTQFVKEIYVTGNAAIGSESMLRALACAGKVFIAERANIIRWVDAEQDIDICRGGNLGISVSSGGKLRVSGQCKFKRLYGSPIVTVDDIQFVSDPESESEGAKSPGRVSPEERYIENITDTAWIVHRKHTVIPQSTWIHQDFIARKDLRIKRECVLEGNIRTYGNLIIGEDVHVSGNVFVEGDVEIGEGSFLQGSLFSQGNALIRKGVRIGEQGKVKSVIVRKGIILCQDVRIYGYVLTDGLGTIS